MISQQTMWAGFLVLITSSTVAHADWPTFQHDVRRTGATTEVLSIAGLKPIWSWQANEPPRPAWAGPALWDAYAGIRDLPAMRDYDSAPHTIIANDCVYFGSTTDDTVRCLDATTGKLRWKVTVDGPVRLAPTFYQGRLLFGSDDGYVYCLDATSGKEHWRYSPHPPTRWIINNGRLISPHPVRTGIIVQSTGAGPEASQQVYFAAGLLPWENSYLCALDLRTGRPDGGYRLELKNKTLEGPPASTGTQLVFPQGRVAPQLFDRLRGKDLGALEKSSGGSIVIVAEDQLLHGPGADSRRGAIAASNAQRQRIATFGRGNAMVVDQAVAYMAADGKLAAADLKTRKSLWQTNTSTLLSLIKAGDLLVAGAVDEVLIFRAEDGRPLWHHAVRGRVKGLAVADGRLLVSTDEGLVVAFGMIASGEQQSSTASDEAILPPAVAANAGNSRPLGEVTVEKDLDLIGRWVFRRDQTRGRVVADLSAKQPPQPARLDGPFRWKRGKAEEFIRWDAAGSALIHADHNQARLPTREITVEAIVRVDRPLKWGGIAGVIQDNGAFERGWLLGYQNDRFSFALAGESSPAAGRGKLTYLAAGQPFQLKRWSHVVGIYDGQQMKLFVDGQLSAQSKDQAGDIWYPPKSFFELGAYHDDNEYYRMTGELHEVRVYRRALDAEELEARFQQARQRMDPLSPAPSLTLLRAPILSFTNTETAVIRWEGVRSPKSGLANSGLSNSGLANSLREYEVRWWEENHATARQRADGVSIDERGETGPTRFRARIGPLRPDRRYRYQVVAETKQGELASEEFLCDTFFNYHPHRPSLKLTSKARETANWFAGLPPHPASPSTGVKATPAGLCLVWGGGLAEEAKALSQHYRVLLMDDDPDRLRRLREAWVSEGSYGSSLVIRRTQDLESVDPRLPGDWANLVVADAETVSADAAELRELLKTQLKPGGGRAFVKTVAASNHTKSSPDGRQWHWIQREVWQDVGDWSHLYGAAHNTAFAGESLGGATDTKQLQVQWIGRPGPRYQADRSGRKPSPLSTDGKLFLQGWRRIVALDAHNGEPLWSWELPEFERFNVPRDSSNWCADNTSVFAAISDELYQFDGSTGKVRHRFQLPNQFRRSSGDADAESPWAWGYSARFGNHLIGSAVRREAMWTDFWGNANAGWYDAKSGEVTAHVASDALFGYRVQTADPTSEVEEPDAREADEVAWSYRGLVLNPTITARDDRIWFLECRNPELVAADNRRLSGDALWSHLAMVCLDASTGDKQWETSLKVAPGNVMVSMCHVDKRLVLLTSGDKSFHVHVVNDSDGAMSWKRSVPWGRDHHGGHMSRPAVVDGVIYVRPFALSLDDGKTLPLRLPMGGCGTYACTTGALFFRQSTVTMWSRENASQSTWSRLRPDCWLSTIPAAGMLLSPEGGGGCSCGTWLETSVGFKPRR